MARRPLPIPEDFADIFLQYQSQNPNWQDINHAKGTFKNPDAQKEFERLFSTRYDVSEKPIDAHNEIRRKLVEFYLATIAKLDQMAENPLLESRGFATPAEYRKSPRTLGKTAQDTWVHPTDRIPTSRENGSTQGEIEGMIVDTRFITRTTLENLDMLDLEAAPRSPYPKRLKHYQNEVVPALKEGVLALEPLRLADEAYAPIEDLNYFRIMRAPTGELVGFQTYNSRKYKKGIFRTDLYGGERRIAHIRKTYRDEAAVLAELETDISNVHSQLGNWRELSDEEKTQLQEKIASGIKKLKYVTDSDKKRFLERLHDSLSLKDKLGRKNPSATMAKLITGLKGDFSGRRRTMQGVSGRMGEDQAVLDRLVTQHETPMNKFLEAVEKYHKNLHIFREGAMSAAEKRKVLHNLYTVRDEMKGLNLEPFHSVAQTFTAHLDEVISHVELNRDAAPNFMKLFFIAKLQRAHAQLMAHYRNLSLNGKEVEPNKLLGQLNTVYRQLKKRSANPGAKLDKTEFKDFYEAFVQFYVFIRDDLQTDTVGAWKDGDLSREQAVEQFKDRVGEFPFTELIQGLAPSREEQLELV